MHRSGTAVGGAIRLSTVTGHDPKEAFEFSHPFLQKAALRLTNEVTLDDGTRFVRVMVEVTGKPPSTTEPH